MRRNLQTLLYNSIVMIFKNMRIPISVQSKLKKTDSAAIYLISYHNSVIPLLFNNKYNRMHNFCLR